MTSLILVVMNDSGIKEQKIVLQVKSSSFDLKSFVFHTSSYTLVMWSGFGTVQLEWPFFLTKID